MNTWYILNAAQTVKLWVYSVWENMNADISEKTIKSISLK